MSRTSWIIILVIIVVLAALAWAMGWFAMGTTPGYPAAQPAAAAAATGGTSAAMVSDATIAQDISVIDTQLSTLMTDTAAYVATPSQSGLDTSVTHLQVVLTLLTQLDISFRARIASQNSTATVVDMEQALSSAQSFQLTLSNTLKTNPKLDAVALKLSGTQLQNALTALQRAQSDAKMVAQAIHKK